MASALTSNIALCNSPLLIRKCIVSMDKGAGLAITHGESTSPNIVIMTNGIENPTDTELSYVHTSDTITTIDCQGTSTLAQIIFIWVHQGSGGIS